MTTRIQVFQERFKTLREHTVQGLGKCHITVMAVLSILSTLHSVRDQQVFSGENQAALYECQHHQELFGALNFYCSYLMCDLFVHIVRELTTKHTSWFKDLLERVAQYESDLTEFKKNVTLKSFSGVKLNNYGGKRSSSRVQKGGCPVWMAWNSNDRMHRNVQTMLCTALWHSYLCHFGELDRDKFICTVYTNCCCQACEKE